MTEDLINAEPWQQIQALEALADQHGVDFRLSKTDGDWAVRLTHNQLHAPIATGYGKSLAEAVDNLHGKAERVLMEKQAQIRKAVEKYRHEMYRETLKMMRGIL